MKQDLPNALTGVARSDRLAGFRGVAVFLALAGLAGCLGAGGNPRVAILDDRFDPDELTVRVQELVEWHHEGSKYHTVTIHAPGTPMQEFVKDGWLENGGATGHRFAAPGTYHVYCKYHSRFAYGEDTRGMIMAVTVE